MPLVKRLSSAASAASDAIDAIGAPAAFAAAEDIKTFELNSGILQVAIAQADRPFEELCALGSRHNPKRPFIFVSKVLGKHWPVKPRAMECVYQDLAAKLDDIKGPTIFAAMAETAIGLGRGVYENFIAAQARDDALFVHTTRYNLNKPVALTVDEPHCHARDHLLFEPRSKEGRKILAAAENLVLVDDEISTGTTLKNLATACLKIAPLVRRLIFVSIANWAKESSPQAFFPQFPHRLEFAALISGTFRFFDNGRPLVTPKFRSEGDFAAKDAYLSNAYGRLGLTPGEPRLDAEKLAQSLGLDPSQPARVIGTGEFLYEPYLLARALEKLGFETIFQSTTRTPIALGGAIGRALRFSDNYHDNIDNFIYNLDPNFAGQTLIVYETSPLPLEHDLPARLKAKAIFL